jgi:hypothetical protein
MDTAGTVSDRRLYQNKSNYNKLPASWKQALDTHLENCRKDYTVRTLNLTRIYCAEALLYFTDSGIDSIEKITYQDIINLVDGEMCCCAKTKSVILVYTARKMHFFYLKGLCPEGYAILLNSQIYPHVGSLTKFSKKHLDTINEIAQIDHDFPSNEFRETIVPFVNTLVKHGYVGTTLSLARHLLTALYLFLDIYALSFHPDIMWIWFAENRQTLGSSWHQWRRILKIYEQYIELGDIKPDENYRYSPNSLETLPPWCRQIINDFLAQIKKGFRKQSTVRKYQFPCIRFCSFLIKSWL